MKYVDKDIHGETQTAFVLYMLDRRVLNEPYYQYKKRLLLRCIQHFISDLIYNMDHMRISGTEPSSVILSQTK